MIHHSEINALKLIQQSFVSQTVIDGFDPDKFRQVNKASGTKTNNSSQFGAIEGTVATTEVEVPGSVPTYDPSEQQLIASLERELMGI